MNVRTNTKQNQKLVIAAFLFTVGQCNHDDAIE